MNDAKAKAWDFVAKTLRWVALTPDPEVNAEVEKIREAMERAAKARRESA